MEDFWNVKTYSLQNPCVLYWKNYGKLTQSWSYELSASWEIGSCERKLCQPGFWVQDLHLSGEMCLKIVCGHLPIYLRLSVCTLSRPFDLKWPQNGRSWIKLSQFLYQNSYSPSLCYISLSPPLHDCVIHRWPQSGIFHPDTKLS